MKRIIIIIFVLKCSLIFSQSFNDKIILLTSDTISGHIMQVNNDNVIIYIKVNDDIQYKNFSLSTVKHIIIDKGNNPELLVSGESESKISNLNGNLPRHDILIVEQTKLRKNQDKPKSISFAKGDRIVIKRFNNKQIVCGKIDTIYDSSVSVKGK